MPALYAATSPPCSSTICRTRRQAEAEAALRVRAGPGRPARTGRRCRCSASAGCRGPLSLIAISRERAIAPHARPEMRPPPVGELRRVVEQVARAICVQPRGIAATPTSARRAVRASRSCARLRASRLAASIAAADAPRAMSTGFVSQLDLAGGDAADVEQVVDQARHLRQLARSITSRHMRTAIGLPSARAA